MTTGGRVLALDLGDVRVGVAVSDPLRVVARPAGWFSRSGPRSDVRKVVALVGEHEAAQIVVGLPLLLGGESGTRADDARALAERLRESVGIPVALWDERLTTVQAERALIEGNVRRRRRRAVVDAVAAAIILQSWLDAHAVADRAAGDHPST